MAHRRDMGPGDDHRPVTVIDEHEDVHPAATPTHVHDEAVAGESEVTYANTGPWDFARGWVRFLQALVFFGLLLVESLLTFRLALALAGANPNAGFSDFIYSVTGPLVEPFEGIVNEQINGESVFEPETVIAMAVYLVAALLVVAFLNLALAAPAPEWTEVVRERHGRYDRHM